MVQRGQHLRLAFEPSQALDIRGDLVGQHFDSRVTAQADVTDAVDLAHSSRAEAADDLIRSEPHSGGQRHTRSMLRGSPPGRGKLPAPASQARPIIRGSGGDCQCGTSMIRGSEPTSEMRMSVYGPLLADRPVCRDRQGVAWLVAVPWCRRVLDQADVIRKD